MERQSKMLQKANALAGKSSQRQSARRTTTITRPQPHGRLKNLARCLLDNQIQLSLNIIGIISIAHIFMPSTRPYLSKLFMLSYYNPNTGKYAAGYDDYYFMASFVLLLTGLRASCMKWILAPLAKRWGVFSAKDATRFAEQGWMLLYYIVFWPMGMYLYVTSPYFLNMQQLWTDWPQREMGFLMKAYILWQWAFWIQQVIVINVEERRKDHWQMLTHHFVTIGLMATSYHYHQTRVGNLILVVMDIIDLFLPLAKCLKYLGFTLICDVLFAGFIISWVIGRHILFVIICWSVYYDLPRIITAVCYKGTAEHLQGPFPVPDNWSHLFDPFLDPAGLICFSQNITNGFLASLLALEVMMIIWFTTIIQIVIRVLQGHSAEDLRSDGEEEDIDKEEIPSPVGDGKQINRREWERRPATAKAASTTSVRIAEKELLNRIGCEKRID